MSWLTPHGDHHVRDLEMRLAEALDRIAELESQVEAWKAAHDRLARATVDVRLLGTTND